MRIYIDTSVINGLYTENFDIKTATERFFDFVGKTGSILYSADLIVKEINNTPQEAKRNKLKEALVEYDKVEINRINREHEYPRIDISSPEEV